MTTSTPFLTLDLSKADADLVLRALRNMQQMRSPRLMKPQATDRDYIEFAKVVDLGDRVQAEFDEAVSAQDGVTP